MGGGGLTGAQGGIIELSSKGIGDDAFASFGVGLAGAGAGACGDGCGGAAFSSLDFFLNQPKNPPFFVRALRLRLYNLFLVNFLCLVLLTFFVI